MSARSGDSTTTFQATLNRLTPGRRRRRRHRVVVPFINIRTANKKKRKRRAWRVWRRRRNSDKIKEKHDHRAKKNKKLLNGKPRRRNCPTCTLMCVCGDRPRQRKWLGRPRNGANDTDRPLRWQWQLDRYVRFFDSFSARGRSHLVSQRRPE